MANTLKVQVDSPVPHEGRGKSWSLCLGRQYSSAKGVERRVLKPLVQRLFLMPRVLSSSLSRESR